MTPVDLREWIKRRNLSHQEAANLLSRSLGSLRHNLYGTKKVGRQTARIAELLDRIERTDALEARIVELLDRMTCPFGLENCPIGTIAHAPKSQKS